ncbi:DUF4157 domain-containing protein [Membranicola marinus]|uniref:DUF4157 domain-containing protein n=1 Tax=Membranihabitans marinus TaxID=1227546 RepID=A0A953HVS8_9BACT|nr:DUF4157 domain-containing protein [Membranihabitans marinus]MBY5956702.1 DUF4157 domain-containing protein [Membranihabitans marinus]
MHLAKTKTSSSAHKSIQKKRQPFFQKEGQDSFFSKSHETTSSFFHSTPVQTKLTIGRPNDKYEVEADAMADKVVQRLDHPGMVQTKPAPSKILTPPVQRKCSTCEEEEKVQKEEDESHEEEIQRKAIFESNEPPPEKVIQRVCAGCLAADASVHEDEAKEMVQKKEEGQSSEGGTKSSLESRLNASRGCGNPLPEDTRSQMESSFGTDFSGVRIHTGSSAVQMNQELHAQAFTYGSDIYFNQGKYDPGSTGGTHLLAHELTHTVQQGGGLSKLQMQRRYFGPGREGVPQNWSTRVTNASSARDRYRLVREAVGQGVTLENRTTQSANDSAPNPRHLFPFSPGNKINYDDGLNSKRSPMDRRPLSSNAGYTLHSRGRHYIVLGRKSLISNAFHHTKVILNHEFDHIRQSQAGSRLAYTESELDAWTSTFLREFHRTYILGDTGRTCYIQSINQFAPLLMYYSNSSSRQAKARAIRRIRAYWNSTLRNHAAHLRVFRYWIHRSMARSANPSLAQALNQNLSLNINASAGLGTTRQFPCTDVANLSYPSPPSLSVPAASSRSRGAFQRKPIDAGNTISDKQFLAKKVNHTGQQGAALLQRNGDACYPEDTDETTLSCDIDFSQQDETLRENGITLAPQDLIELAGIFPDGITLNSTELFILVQGEAFANSIRLNGYRVNTSRPSTSSTNVFVLQIGKGRAIMVSSTVGGSIMLDAGGGTSRTSNSQKARQIARDVNNILLSGIAAPPRRITISHIDLDHYNAVQEVLNLPQMRNTDVRITRQQLMEGLRSGNWQTMNIQFNRANKLVRINVSGVSSVHIDRAFIGGMEVTEFRSVQAHEQLTDRNRIRYNKNSTSEVTIVRDFLTNTTHVFTADGEGRTIHEIIDMVGREAFRRIMGGGSRNLASVEAPHHGGSVTGGANTRGMVEFLRLAFESSNGRVNFFTQTSQRFSGTGSASLNYLDAVEIPVERIQEGGNASNTTQVRRISGQAQEQITIDRGRITEILELGNANASRVMAAQQTRHKLSNFSELITPIERMLGLEGTRAEFRQLGEAASSVRRNIQNSQQALNTPWNEFWEVMKTEAETSGMRASTPRQQVRQALATLSSQVRNTEVSRLENDVISLYNGLNIYQRLLTNALAMRLALNEGRISDLNALKAEQRNLLSRSISLIGRAETSQQIRQAWRAIREVWTGRLIRTVARRLGHYSAAHRHMMTDFRVVLNENIVNQARLNQLVEQARHGTLPMAPGRTIPMRSRIGAGFMAAIEITRIGLELYESFESAARARESRDAAERVEGLQDIRWWQDMGAQPEIELVERGAFSGWNIVSSHLRNSTKMEILNGTYTGETPNFDKAVVTEVSDEDLEFVVGKMTIELIDMNDWVRNYGHPVSENGRIKKFENGWGVKLWSSENESYRYYSKNIIQNPLNALYANLQDQLKEELEYQTTNPDNELATVENTAFFGTDRYIYVYNGPTLKRLDFEDRVPKFFVTGLQAPTNPDLVSVRAADVYTYNKLSRYNTIEIEPGLPYNTIRSYRNSRGEGYVERDSIRYSLKNIINNAIP